jgi:hypothetical protein
LSRLMDINEENGMKINNVTIQAAAAFVEQVKADLSLAKKSKRLVCRWNFTEGQPQFSAIMTHKTAETAVRSVVAENRVDLSRPLGLSDTPVVEQVSLSLEVESDSGEGQPAEIERMARGAALRSTA